jgi:hypothetical protein
MDTTTLSVIKQLECESQTSSYQCWGVAFIRDPKETNYSVDVMHLEGVPVFLPGDGNTPAGTVIISNNTLVKDTIFVKLDFNTPHGKAAFDKWWPDSHVIPEAMDLALETVWSHKPFEQMDSLWPRINTVPTTAKFCVHSGQSTECTYCLIIGLCVVKCASHAGCRIYTTTHAPPPPQPLSN